MILYSSSRCRLQGNSSLGKLCSGERGGEEEAEEEEENSTKRTFTVGPPVKWEPCVILKVPTIKFTFPNPPNPPPLLPSRESHCQQRRHNSSTPTLPADKKTLPKPKMAPSLVDRIGVSSCRMPSAYEGVRGGVACKSGDSFMLERLV